MIDLEGHSFVAASPLPLNYDLVTEEDEIVFVAPKLNPGAYDVIVNNSARSDTLAGGFTVK